MRTLNDWTINIEQQEILAGRICALSWRTKEEEKLSGGGNKSCPLAGLSSSHLSPRAKGRDPEMQPIIAWLSQNGLWVNLCLSSLTQGLSDSVWQVATKLLPCFEKAAWNRCTTHWEHYYLKWYSACLPQESGSAEFAAGSHKEGQGSLVPEGPVSESWRLWACPCVTVCTLEIWHTKAVTPKGLIAGWSIDQTLCIYDTTKGQ